MMKGKGGASDKEQELQLGQGNKPPGRADGAASHNKPL